jgi:hypothetical protein
VCICSLRYPERNAHESYFNLWPAPLYDIFPRYLINGTIFEKKNVSNHRICVLIFSTTFVWNTSHSKKERARYVKQMFIGLYVNYPVFLYDFNETRNVSTEFRKIFKYQISLKSLSWEPSCSIRTDGQTGRHDEAIGRFSQFCERDQKLPNRWGNPTYRRAHSLTQYQTCLKHNVMNWCGNVHL